MSLRVRLMLLVLVALVPAWGLLGWAVGRERARAGAEARREALRLALAGAAHEAALVEDARHALTLAAQLPEVRAGERVAAERALAALIERAPGCSTLGVMRPDGSVIATVARGGRAGAAPEPAFGQRVREAGEFRIGDYQVRGAPGRTGLLVGAPVLGANGGVLATLYAVIEPGWLASLGGESGVPSGTAWYLLDPGALVLGAWPNAEFWTGKSIPDMPLARAVLGRGEGTAETAGPDDAPRIFGFVPLRGRREGSAFLAVGLARDAAYAAADQAFAWNIAGLSVASAVALLVVWLGGQWLVVRRIAVLGEAVERLSQGEWGHRVRLEGADELAAMAGAFNRMGERLGAMLEAGRETKEKLAGQVERRTREVGLLHEMGELLQSCATPDEAYKVIARIAQTFFPQEGGALFVINSSGNLAEKRANWGAFAVTPDAEEPFPPEDCWALRRGQVHHVEDTASGLLCKHLRNPMPPAYICIPLVAQGKTLGVLHLAAPPGPRQPATGMGDSSRRLVATVAEHGALALANLNIRETLQNQSTRDPLTDLYNRRYMEESLEREVRRAARAKKPLGAIMFDVDHFKKFNDTFGHAAADLVLKELGRVLKRLFRAEDVACRYGGDEYVVLLPDATLADTRRRAEELAAEARKIHISHDGQSLGQVSLSIGVAVYPEHGLTGEALLRGADSALYRAKHEGRDRVHALA